MKVFITLLLVLVITNAKGGADDVIKQPNGTYTISQTKDPTKIYGKINFNSSNLLNVEACGVSISCIYKYQLERLTLISCTPTPNLANLCEVWQKLGLNIPKPVVAELKIRALTPSQLFLYKSQFFNIKVQLSFIK